MNTGAKMAIRRVAARRKVDSVGGREENIDLFKAINGKYANKLTENVKVWGNRLLLLLLFHFILLCLIHWIQLIGQGGRRTWSSILRRRKPKKGQNEHAQQSDGRECCVEELNCWLAEAGVLGIVLEEEDQQQEETATRLAVKLRMGMNKFELIQRIKEKLNSHLLYLI
jgi:hypothetical protein